MAKLSIVAGATSQSVNIFIQNSSSTVGAGLTGLVFNSGSLIAYYTFAGTSTTATAITLATLAAVNSAYSSGGFKEIDSVHMPGVYRLDIPNAALAAASGRSVLIMLSGATNMAPCLLEIELTGVDNQDGVHFGLTALPNAAAAASGGLLISGSNAGTTTLGALTVTAATTLTGNVALANGLTITQATGNGHGISVTGNGTGHGILATSGAGLTGDGIKGISASTNGNGIEGVGTGTGDGLAATGGATGRGIHATGGATSGAGILATATAGNSDGITATHTGSGVDINGNLLSVTSLTNAPTAGDLTATMKTSVTTACTASTPTAAAVTARVTANTDQLAGQAVTAAAGVTFPTSVASPTNITAGVITTVTNLTNAPTAGDFTATMKTSLNAATPASVTGAVASVTGNVGGNVTGSVGSVVGAVGSVTAAVTAGTVTDKTGYSLAAGQLFVKKNVGITITFPMTDSTTHAPKAGLAGTITCQRSIDGAAIGACANANTELSGGLYSLVLAAGDVNGTQITLILSAAGADTRFIGIVTQA